MIRSIAIIGICVAPSAAFAIGPRLATVWASPTTVDAETVVFLILQTVATLTLALASHEAGQSREWGKRLACFGLVALVGILQFGSALDVASHAQDSRATVASDSLEQRATVAAALGTAVDARSKLPQEKQALVTEDMVTDARSAKEGECGKRGPLCRAKEDELKELSARRAIWAEIEKHTEAQKKLGAGSNWIDGKAYRFGRMISAVGIDIGKDEKERTAWVIDWWPVFVAFVIELIAGLGPYALARRPEPHARTVENKPAKVEMVEDIIVKEAVEEPVTTVRKATVSRTAATVVKPKKTKVSKAATVGGAESVVSWHKSRTIARAGSDLKPEETYKTAYLPWCAEQKIEPVSFVIFGRTMKKPVVEGGCGVAYEMRNRRGFYTGIALISRPALAVKNA